MKKDSRDNSRRLTCRILGFAAGSFAPGFLLVIGAFDIIDSGRSIRLFDTWVSKDVASNIVLWDRFRLGGAGIALGRGVLNAIMATFDIGKNDARDWPLHLASGFVCMAFGLLGAWIAGVLFSIWPSKVK